MEDNNNNNNNNNNHNYGAAVAALVNVLADGWKLRQYVFPRKSFIERGCVPDLLLSYYIL